MKKTIFITGTSSGIGKSTVELFAKQGWNVIATVRNQYIYADIFSDMPNVTVYELDVTDEAQVQEVSAMAIKKFGRIDVVVNNAAYCLIGPTETSTMKQIKSQYETNVFGVFAVTKSFIAHFRKNGGGMFINIASSSGQFNYPYIGAYGSSKWAVRGLTESLGIELAPFNIDVKAIYPGVHATKIFTKLDYGVHDGVNAFQAYKDYYSNFFSGQSGLSEVTSPDNIAREVWKAANHRNGKLHIISGGDAKLFAFLKKVLSQRVFQRLQVRSIMKPATKGELSFAKWLMGKNTGTLEVVMDQKLLH